MNGQGLANLRTVILQRAGGAVQGYICIRDQPLGVGIGKYFIEGMIQHLVQSFVFQSLHGLIAVPEDKVNALALLIKQQLDHTEGDRHVIQDVEGRRDVIDACHRQIDVSVQGVVDILVILHAPLAAFEYPAVDQGIDISIDLYDLISGYQDSLVDHDKVIGLQKFSQGFHCVKAGDDSFVQQIDICLAVFSENVFNIGCENAIFAQEALQSQLLIHTILLHNHIKCLQTEFNLKSKIWQVIFWQSPRRPIKYFKIITKYG